MANTLLINKLTGGYFQFVLNGNTANAVRGIKNDLLAVGNQLHFKTGNGANIVKEQFIYPVDLTIVASGTFTFTNVDQVWTKLIEIGYFDWISSGGGGSAATRFDDLLDTFKYTGKDGQVVIVNESQQKLQTIPLFNYRKFTELEDTPDLLIANKMVATNEAGTALIFKNLPEDPVNYLNSIGFFDYNDLATKSTPISVDANTDVKLRNDTLGAFTNISYPPYGVSFLWDATTNRFNFSQLSIGDTIDVRIHLQVTTTTSNQAYKIGAKFGIGSASAFDNTIYSDQVKTAGVHEVSFVAPFYIGEANILNNPAELYINSDATASVKVDGWYIRILRRNINIVNVETGVNDATTTVKGIVRLAGDLAGTATNPTVPELANKALKSTTLTINGTTFDLSANREWAISSSANWGSIGGVLSNQTDLQTALNAKQNSSADLSSIAGLTGTSGLLRKTAANTYSLDTNTYALDSGVVKLAGNQTITGEKTFTTTVRTNFENNDFAQVSFKNTSDLTKVLSIGQGSINSNIFSSTGLDFRVGGLTTSALLIASNENATFKENVTANSFIKSGGTASQILAADGSSITAGTNITISGGTISASGGGSVGSLEFNSTDLTVWNNGKGNIATNTSFGDGALKSNTSGFFNEAYGGNSLMNNTTGTMNVAIGSRALISNTTGVKNIALGTEAGAFAGSTEGLAFSNTTSSESVFIGANTRPLANNQTNQIVIGNSAMGHGSNTVTLGNSSIVTTILRGNVGIGTTSPTRRLDVAGVSIFNGTQVRSTEDGNTIVGFFGNRSAWTGGSLSNELTIAAYTGNICFFTNNDVTERMRITSGGSVVVNNLGTGLVYSNAGALTSTNPSDERLKENIDDLEYGLNEILQLRPVSYNWKNDTINQGKQFGFIAQEVQEIMPELINEFTFTEDEEEVVRLGLDKEAIFVAMVNAIKELKAEIELLKQ